MLVSCLASSLILKIKACSNATSADFQRTAQRYIPEDTSVHIYHSENLKSSISR
jgi:hypothetical protein